MTTEYTVNVHILLSKRETINLTSRNDKRFATAAPCKAIVRAALGSPLDKFDSKTIESSRITLSRLFPIAQT